MSIQVSFYRSLRDLLASFVMNLICCFDEESDKTLAIFAKAVQILNKDLVRL